MIDIEDILSGILNVLLWVLYKIPIYLLIGLVYILFFPLAVIKRLKQVDWDWYARYSHVNDNLSVTYDTGLEWVVAAIFQVLWVFYALIPVVNLIRGYYG